MFSTDRLTSAAIEASAAIPSSVKVMPTFSVCISALYCSVSALSVSDRMRTKSSSVSARSSTRIGRRP